VVSVSGEKQPTSSCQNSIGALLLCASVGRRQAYFREQCWTAGLPGTLGKSWSADAETVNDRPKARIGADRVILRVDVDEQHPVVVMLI
jgi:hypothetical protein